MKKLEMKFIVNIKDDDIKAIVEIAEEETMHWSVKASNVTEDLSIPLSQHVIQGGNLMLHSKVTDKDYCLTYNNLISGIQRYIEMPTDIEFLEYVDSEMQIDTNCIDEDVVDAILQYGIFDKIVYIQGIRI